MSSPSAHDFISELIALIYLFKCGTGQILDNIHVFFNIVQCPQYKLLLKSSPEVFGNANKQIMILVSVSLESLKQILDIQATLSEIFTREVSDLDQP